MAGSDDQLAIPLIFVIFELHVMECQLQYISYIRWW